MYNVVLLDDEKAILDGIYKSIVWEEYGLTVTRMFTDPYEALAYLKEQPADILMTDIKIPEMSGLDVIHCLRENRIQTLVIILSGFQDFEFVKKALVLGVENYLVKPLNKDELASTLLTVIEKLDRRSLTGINDRDLLIFQDNLLYRFVSERISPDEFIERAGLIGIPLTKSGYRIAILTNCHDYNLFRQRLSDILLDMDGVGFISFVEPGGDLILLFFSDNKPLMNEALNASLYRFSQENIEINVSVGFAVGTYENLSSSYRFARRLSFYQRALYNIHYLDEAVFIKLTSVFKYEPIINAIENGNISHAVSQLNEYLKTIKQSDVSLTLTALMLPICDLLRKRTSHISEDISSLFKSVSTAKDKQSLSQAIDELFKGINLALLEGQRSLNPLISRTLRYIEQNLEKDFSLKTIAFEFDVTPAYLGQLFKKEVGEIFSDYIHLKRIDKAKELLAKESMKVNQIAEMVGYYSQSHFYKIFKKLTGVSPVEYRKSLFY